MRDTTVASGEVPTVPHVSMMYSVIELEVATALAEGRKAGASAGAPFRFRQFYPDRDIGPTFALRQCFVHLHGDGKVELRHDWLSGTGDITVYIAARVRT